VVERPGVSPIGGEVLEQGYVERLAAIGGKRGTGEQYQQAPRPARSCHGLLVAYRPFSRAGQRIVPGVYHASAYASNLGPAPALNTPVARSTMMPVFLPRNQACIGLGSSGVTNLYVSVFSFVSQVKRDF